MAEPALERIAFVASRYPTLRGGVIRAVVGICILSGGLFDYFFNDREPGLVRAVIGMANLFVVSAIGITLMFRSRRWLDRRFGQVRAKSPFPPMIGLLVCQVGFFASSRLDEFYLGGSSYPSARFLFVAAVGAWFCVRLWPRSLHYLVPTLVAAGFALQHGALRGEQAVGSWEVMAYGTSLLAWIAAGLVDLVILLNVLPRQRGGDTVAADAEQDLARIAFVTRRFGDLQGLRSAWLGAALVVFVVSVAILPAGYADPFFFVAMPAQNAMIFSSVMLNGYYERCFGRVPANGRAPQRLRGSQRDQAAGVSLGLVLLAMQLDLLKSLFYPGGLSLGAAALTSYSAWILWRDWPHRMHHLLGVAAGVVGLVISSSVPVTTRTIGQPMDPAVAGVYAQTYAIFGLGLLAVGLLDHRLLAQAMVRSTLFRHTTPDRSGSRLRVSVSAACLLITASYVLVAGWPTDPLGMYMSLYLGITGVMVVFGAGYLAVTGIRDYRTAERNRIARTEARLLAQIASIRGEKLRQEIESPARLVEVPHFDSLGHFVLPFAIACGALVDTATRGTGVPSLLALALAASHLRIAVRDWPSRRYYLLGTLAASISAVHFMFVSPHQVLDWTVWFLILTCAAMLIEGLLDLRLARDRGEQHFSKEHHADAI